MHILFQIAELGILLAQAVQALIFVAMCDALAHITRTLDVVAKVMVAFEFALMASFGVTSSYHTYSTYEPKW